MADSNKLSFSTSPKAEQFPPKFHGLVLGLVGLKCPHKINFITQCMSARRATCEGVGCFGWESWINSPWLSMSVRAIPIRNQKKNAWLRLHFLITSTSIFEPLSHDNWSHGLRMPREKIAFPAWPKIQSQSQIVMYGRSIFCLPHRPNFSDIFDLCPHWVSVVRDWSHAAAF